MNSRPFLKWAGGKFRLLSRILAELPAGERFVEPFAGSCAVYLNVPCSRALIADANADLIGLYQCLQREGERFIHYCKSFFLPEYNTKAAYLALRERYNAATSSSERGALLLYLNRHSYNGLVRYNAAGGYNVPFGAHKKPYFPLRELQAFYQKILASESEFVCQDFRTIFAALRPGDVVYCDPPYVPLSPTATFTAYAGKPFSPKDQRDLADLARQAFRKGIPVLISNHDTDLARTLYPAAILKSFPVRRHISRNGNNRFNAPELLAIYR